ncbi:MAG: hypothetical protein FWG65_11330 [Turicibacter sp.]|nr:hypothetical protein [Turicibacter sp.]
MNEKHSAIDYSDIPAITDFSRARKNPHAAAIKENGYSVTVHYSPEDVAKGQIHDMKDIVQALIELMSESEAKQLLVHIKNNYDLPCSPHLWEVLD